MVTRDIHAKFDLGSIVALLSLGSFEYMIHIFGILDILAQLITSSIIKYIMVNGILSKVDSIITSHHGYRFPSNRSILPTNKYLIAVVSSLNNPMIINLAEQEELSLVLEFGLALQLCI